jgi:hypothetical protein
VRRERLASSRRFVRRELEALMIFGHGSGHELLPTGT